MAEKFTYDKIAPLSDYAVFTGTTAEPKDFAAIALDIPCQEACPAHTDVPAYIERIFSGDEIGAYSINVECNVFPGALGRICTRPCEDACRHNRTDTDGPVTICHLKRYSADTAERADVPAHWFDKSGKRVAIIGAGPAGLTAARECARLGHEVVVFERRPYAGGMLREGIPAFRLPRAVLDTEIRRIVDDAHVSIRFGEAIDGLKTAEIAQEYDAVICATGAVSPIDPGIDASGSLSGLAFMEQFNNSLLGTLSGDTVVIGGGFTAVDCSRAAARLLNGSNASVTMIYRRSEKHLAAHRDEIEQMREEGITIRTLVSPVAILRDNGLITGIRCIRNRLDRTSPEGKPVFISIDGSEFVIPCSRVIVAVGQRPDLSVLPAGIVQKDACATSAQNIFTAGDLRLGSKDVITAVADAKAAARAVDRYLMGRDRLTYAIRINEVDTNGRTGRVRNHDTVMPPPMPVSSLSDRLQNAFEVELGFDSAAATTNASRCYFCNNHFEINSDTCIQCQWCIEVCPRKCISAVSRVVTDANGVVVATTEAYNRDSISYIRIDSTDCIRCGRCLRVCPTKAISMRKVERCVNTVCQS